MDERDIRNEIDYLKSKLREMVESVDAEIVEDWYHDPYSEYNQLHEAIRGLERLLISMIPPLPDSDVEVEEELYEEPEDIHNLEFRRGEFNVVRVVYDEDGNSVVYVEPAQIKRRRD